MRRGAGKIHGFALGSLLLLGGLVLAGQNKKPLTPEEVFQKQIAPAIKTYCGNCHSGSNPPANLHLLKYKTLDDMVKDRDVWDRVARNIGSGFMPPQGAPGIPKAKREELVRLIDSTLAAACEMPDPGKVTIRRLNRLEYDNSIRDLTGLDLDLAVDFPSDDVGHGFDNIGDVLTLSPLLMEKYLDAAEKVADAAIVTPDYLKRKLSPLELPEEEGARNSDSARHMYSNSEMGATLSFPRAGSYRLKAQAFGQQAGPEPCKMAFLVDNRPVQTVEVRATQDKPLVYEVPLTLQKGSHKVAVAFVNDYYMPNHPDPKQRDRNLVVFYLEVEGPLDAPAALPASHTRIITAQPAAKGQEAVALKKVLGEFASRAYRRPAKPDEVERLVQVASLALKNGESYEHAVRLGIQAVLVSPHFLFRVELDEKPNHAQVRELNEFELASRLSYFLWSSIPDDTLRSLAAQKKLHEPAVLKAQIKRMLADPKASALAEGFAEQWLQLRRLPLTSPDPKLFPVFTDQLRQDMAAETLAFFRHIQRENRSILEFLDCDYAFLNERLAALYGVSGVNGAQLRKVQLSDRRRGGLITQASILTLTSNPTRTSPVKRGKWVLENLLNAPPPPPPPGVDQLAEGPTITAKTLRERMEEHRKNPACANCHARLDPIGFGLENFDAVGAWRDEEGDVPIDASGELTDGKAFEGPLELKQVLLEKKHQFVQCLAEKLLTYAIGRGLTAADRCAIDDISVAATKNDYRFSALVEAVVFSDPFLKRRGGGAR